MNLVMRAWAHTTSIWARVVAPFIQSARVINEGKERGKWVGVEEVG